MAIEADVRLVDGKIVSHERTVQVAIITPYSADGVPNYTLNVARELRYLDADGKSLSGAAPLEVRGYSWNFADIKDQVIKSGKFTVTIAQLADLIRVGVDQLVEAKKAEIEANEAAAEL